MRRAKVVVNKKQQTSWEKYYNLKQILTAIGFGLICALFIWLILTTLLG